MFLAEKKRNQQISAISSGSAVSVFCFVMLFFVPSVKDAYFFLTFFFAMYVKKSWHHEMRFFLWLGDRMTNDLLANKHLE